MTDELEEAVTDGMVDQRLARNARQNAHDAAVFRVDPNWEGFYAHPDPAAAADELGVGVEFAFYHQARAAAIAAGTFTPSEETTQ